MSEAFSAESEDLTLASNERECELCGSASRTSSASESLLDTGPESPVTTTSGKSQGYNWRLTEKQKAEATRRYEAGESCGQIAKDYGVSRQGMWDIVRRRTQMRDRIEALPRVEDRSKLQAKRKAALERYRSRAKRITRAQIKAVRERDQVCVKCGEPGTDIDHIVPVRRGGQTEMDNLQLLCNPCHIEKSRADYREGVV